MKQNLKYLLLFLSPIMVLGTIHSNQSNIAKSNLDILNDIAEDDFIYKAKPKRKIALEKETSEQNLTKVKSNLTILDQTAEDDFIYKAKPKRKIALEKETSEQNLTKVKSKVKSNLAILDEMSENDTKSKAKPKSKLDLADENYRHIRQRNLKDKILPSLTLELAQKHMEAQEYLVAQYYVKIYLRDYSVHGNLDKAWFLAIQSVYMKLKTSESQEDFLAEVRRLSNDFEKTFPNSIYRKEVITMLEDAMGTEYMRNENIAKYYENIGKLKAAQFYRAKNSNNPAITSKIKIQALRKSTLSKIHSNLDVLDED